MNAFFSDLNKFMSSEGLLHEPSRIYNIDESGCHQKMQDACFQKSDYLIEHRTHSSPIFKRIYVTDKYFVLLIVPQPNLLLRLCSSIYSPPIGAKLYGMLFGINFSHIPNLATYSFHIGSGGLKCLVQDILYKSKPCSIYTL